MQASLERMGTGFVGNGMVARCWLRFQGGNHGSTRRPSQYLKSQRLMARSLSGKDQPSVGSMGELAVSEDFLSPSKNSSREGVTSEKPHLRSWYGKDGELISSLPCPDCRGRGYIVCPICDVGTPDSSCVECNGKGLKRCPNCLGKRTVLLQPAFEEITLKENASSGPLLQIEDDEIIDRMDINLPARKSKRVYSAMPLEVRENIRNALKGLSRGDSEECTMIQLLLQKG